MLSSCVFTLVYSLNYLVCFRYTYLIASPPSPFIHTCLSFNNNLSNFYLVLSKSCDCSLLVFPIRRNPDRFPLTDAYLAEYLTDCCLMWQAYVVNNVADACTHFRVTNRDITVTLALFMVLSVRSEPNLSQQSLNLSNGILCSMNIELGWMDILDYFLHKHPGPMQSAQ